MPIDPFSTEGAKRIAQIAGQGTAPISASVLSSQPAPLNIPQAVIPPLPAIPSLDSILSFEETSTQQRQDALLSDVADKTGQLGQEEAFRVSQEQGAGLDAKKATVRDLTTQFNTLNAEADAAITRAEDRPIGLGFIRGEQAQIDRQRSIRQLGISAALNAANGNLASAQDQVETAVRAKFAPIRAQIEAQRAQLTALEPRLNREEQQRSLKVQAQLAERERILATQEEKQKAIYSTMLEAARLDADASTLRSIQNARTPEEAVTIAGNVLGADFRQRLEQQTFDNNLKLRDAALSEAKFTYQKIAARAASVGNVVTANTATGLTNILSTSKIGQATKTKLADILGVINATEDLANSRPDGKFTGFYPGSSIVNFFTPAAFKKSTTVENEGYLDAINLKVQQWASGAALTVEQTKQVQRFTPSKNDSDRVVQTKMNNLVNFMHQQIKGSLQSEGIPYTPEKVDLFKKTQTLADIFNQ